MKRKRELELVMAEVKKLSSGSNYADLEDAVKRGLKNVRREKYQDHLKRKAKKKGSASNTASFC